MDTKWSKEMLEKKKAKWADGIYTGPHAPFGYCIKKTPYRHLEIDEQSGEVVKLLFKLVASGHTVNQIVMAMNEQRGATPSEYAVCGTIYVTKNLKKSPWTHKMLMGILQNKIYIGCLEHGKGQGNHTIIENTHEALVDEAMFRLVQRNLVKGTSGSAMERLFADYEGRMYCGHCGKRIRKKIRGKYVYYGCLDSMKNGETIKGCKGVMMERAKLIKELDRMDWSGSQGDLVMGVKDGVVGVCAQINESTL